MTTSANLVDTSSVGLSAAAQEITTHASTATRGTSAVVRLNLEAFLTFGFDRNEISTPEKLRAALLESLIQRLQLDSEGLLTAVHVEQLVDE